MEGLRDLLLDIHEEFLQIRLDSHTTAPNTGLKALCGWLSRTYILLLYPTKQMQIPFALTSAPKLDSLSSLCR